MCAVVAIVAASVEQCFSLWRWTLIRTSSQPASHSRQGTSRLVWFVRSRRCPRSRPSRSPPICFFQLVSPPTSRLEWPGADEELGSLQARGSHHEGHGQTTQLFLDRALRKALNPECRSWITRTSSNSSRPSKIAPASFSDPLLPLLLECSKLCGLV